MRILPLTIIALLVISSLPAISFALVNTYEINYNLGLNSVDENIHVIFADRISDAVQITFVNRIEVLDVRDEKGVLRYELLSGENTTIKIYPDSSEEIFIRLEQFNAVLSSAEFYQFIDDFSTEEDIGKLVVSASLPRGYVIYKNSFLPNNAEIITDGERITLLWVENDVKSPSMVYSIKFVGTSDYGLIFIPVIIILILIVAIIFFYRHHKKKLLHEFKKGFSEDEIKVVDIMKKEKTVYQKKIEKELHFSRAKMTRITEKLKHKSLIEKKRYGRTNRLKWKG